MSGLVRLRARYLAGPTMYDETYAIDTFTVETLTQSFQVAGHDAELTISFDPPLIVPRTPVEHGGD